MSTFALALGAGGARGLAHIHAIRALEELGVKPTCVSGASIGSIVGAAYCSGMGADEITAHAETVVSDPLDVLRGMFRVGPGSLAAFFKEGGPRIGEMNLERVLAGILPDSIPQTFDALDIPLLIAATDFYGQCRAVFDSGDLRFSMAASSAIPAVFLPVERDGRFFIDGNATDPCPLDVLVPKADRIIAIDVTGGAHGDPTKRPGKMDVTHAAAQMMQRAIVRNAAARFPQAMVLRPPVDAIWSLDFLKVREILAQTESLKEEVKIAIGALLESQG